MWVGEIRRDGVRCDPDLSHYLFDAQGVLITYAGIGCISSVLPKKGKKCGPPWVFRYCGGPRPGYVPT